MSVLRGLGQIDYEGAVLLPSNLCVGMGGHGASASEVFTMAD